MNIPEQKICTIYHDEAVTLSAKYKFNNDLLHEFTFKKELTILQKIIDMAYFLWLRRTAYNEQTLHLQDLWINNLPAEYLTGFMTSQKKATALTQEGSGFFLTFSHTDLHTFFITIVYTISEKEDKPLSVASSLMVLGLKKLIKKMTDITNRHPYDHEKTPLFFHGEKLNDRNTLGECGIKDGDLVELALTPLGNRLPSSLQMHTGSDYLSTRGFKKYTSTMINMSNIVCKIERKDSEGKIVVEGTGFLIDIKNRLIMTNKHVIDENHLNETKAKFFYEEESNTTEECKIVEVVQGKETPKQTERISREILDFVICKINIPEPEKSMLLKIVGLDSFISQFFQKLQNNQDLNKMRANIIQHPKGEPKKIAFRESRIKDVEQFLLHYESETDEGSSGAPVINDEGQFIGLHASSCREIEIQLSDNEVLVKLLSKLQIEYQPFEIKYQCKHPKIGNLDVYHSGENKGWCRDTVNVKPFSLLELITKITPNEFEEYGGTRGWAHHFLTAECNRRVDQLHINCNTAIVATHIHEAIETFKTKEADSSKHVSGLSKKNISNSPSPSVSNSIPNYWIGIGVVCFLGLMYWKSKNEDSK